MSEINAECTMCREKAANGEPGKNLLIRSAVRLDDGHRPLCGYCWDEHVSETRRAARIFAKDFLENEKHLAAIRDKISDLRREQTKYISYQENIQSNLSSAISPDSLPVTFVEGLQALTVHYDGERDLISVMVADLEEEEKE